MAIEETTLLGLGVALGAGLLIGIERERRKGSGPQRAVAGVRTFTLASLAGAMAQVVVQPWLVAVGALLILALTAISYWRSPSDDPGITTELALFVTYLLGVTAVEHPALAAGAAVVVASLLAARTSIHEFSIEALTAAELRDALLLFGSALVVLPLLPESIVWLPAIHPYRLWGLVVLFMAIQAAGYVAMRILGARLGLALSGLAAGFVSSTATIAALGARARQDPTLLLACVSGAMFSTLATILLLGIVAVALHVPVLRVIAPSIVLALIVILAIASASLRRKQGRQDVEPPKGRAFNLWHAIGFATLLSVVTSTVALASAHFGQSAVNLATALAGFFDVHAASASAFSLAANHKLEARGVLVPMLLAVTTNTLSKMGAAFVAGGRAYALRVSAGLLVVLAAAWAPLLWS